MKIETKFRNTKYRIDIKHKKPKSIFYLLYIITTIITMIILCIAFMFMIYLLNKDKTNKFYWDEKYDNK